MGLRATVHNNGFGIFASHCTVRHRSARFERVWLGLTMERYIARASASTAAPPLVFALCRIRPLCVREYVCGGFGCGVVWEGVHSSILTREPQNDTNSRTRAEPGSEFPVAARHRTNQQHHWPATLFTVEAWRQGC